MALIFNDTFTVASDTDLDAHTPDTGTSWTKVWGTDAASKYSVIAASDDCRQAAGTNKGCLYTADATYDSADYYIETTVKGVATTTEPVFLCLRVADQENFYSFSIQGTSSIFRKKVAGTWTALGATITAPVVNDVVRFEVSGSTLSVDYNAVEQTTRTDTDLTATGKAGLGGGGGAEMFNSGHDLNASNIIDSFGVTTAAGGGATVTPGVIVATAALPAATGSASSTATPGVIGSSVALPSLGLSLGATATPGVLAAVGSLPQAAALTGTNATVTPAVLVAVVVLPQAALSLGATASPGAIQAVVALPQAGLSTQANVRPDPVAAMVALPQATGSGVSWAPVARRSTTAVSRRATTAVNRRGA